MAFVGRQYRIEVGGDEFFVDLLFFHATLDYALASTASPVAVALYEGLTPKERAELPDPDELEAVIEAEIQARGSPTVDSAPADLPV